MVINNLHQFISALHSIVIINTLILNSLASLKIVTMSLKHFKVRNLMLIGQCMAHTRMENATKVKIQLLEFNSFLKMYFPKEMNIFAYDPKSACKDGDVVLLRKRPEKLTKYITHDLVKILYPFGDVTDPISGKKCVSNVYRETLKLEKEVYGIADDGTGGFDYDSAPERGWQEGRKDFTHKPSYKKFHNFNPDHPMYNDPSSV